jgi:hypothetical protein
MSHFQTIQVYLHNKESVQQGIDVLKKVYANELQGGNYRLVMQIAEPGEPHTDAQRKKCHAWFGEIAMETANTPALVKDGLMQLFFVEEPYEFKGVTLFKRKSFTELSKKEVTYLMEQVDAWASTEGIYLK